MKNKFAYEREVYVCIRGKLVQQDAEMKNYILEASQFGIYSKYYYNGDIRKEQFFLLGYRALQFVENQPTFGVVFSSETLVSFHSHGCENIISNGIKKAGMNRECNYARGR
jgi:hypothetical protein